MPRRRIAVVSPFIDKRHGTERRVAECISRLAGDYEFHIYSNRVEDVDLDRVVWHRIPVLPGPHLFAYLWWFAANHFWRWRDRRFRGLAPAVVYSPGINCLDADAISVHIVFARFRDCVKDELHLTRNPLVSWPQLIHRRLYYRLIEALEGHIYPRHDLALAVVSHKVGADLGHYYGRTDGISVIYNGLDPERFSPERRAGLRASARGALGLAETDFALLLIGNDWKNKGLLVVCCRQPGGVGDPRLKVFGCWPRQSRALRRGDRKTGSDRARQFPAAQAGCGIFLCRSGRLRRSFARRCLSSPNRRPNPWRAACRLSLRAITAARKSSFTAGTASFSKIPPIR